MFRKVILLVTLALLVLGVGALSAQDSEPLVIGLLVDQSGPLTIYGFELEYGFKLGLLYEAGIDPADYDNDMDAALAAVQIAGRSIEVIVRDNASNADTAASQARELIEQEGAETDVLSDDAIVEILKEAGIDIARRTVAKYREALRIPSSMQRRRMLRTA